MSFLGTKICIAWDSLNSYICLNRPFVMECYLTKVSYLS